MTTLRAGFLLGFHGCSKAVADGLLAGKEFEMSAKRYDWLGPGVYFWEGDARRAWEWAQEKVKDGAYEEPAVVGAVVDLGRCLDLTVRENLDLLADAHDSFKEATAIAKLKMPVNQDGRDDSGGDKLLRYLDCAVITHLHENMATDFEPFDTVRGMFLEGRPVYEGGGFYSHTHTQIAVRNQNCIKGVFLPRGDLGNFTDEVSVRSVSA